jgi:flagellar protein FlbD
MIALHRLAHAHDPALHLNPDLIVSVESTPDTVVTLITGTKVLVTERPDEVAEAVRSWRSSILSAAIREAGPSAARRARAAGLSLVQATSAVPTAAVAPSDDEGRR